MWSRGSARGSSNAHAIHAGVARVHGFPIARVAQRWGGLATCSSPASDPYCRSADAVTRLSRCVIDALAIGSSREPNSTERLGSVGVQPVGAIVTSEAPTSHSAPDRGEGVAPWALAPAPVCLEGEMTLHRAVELRDTLLGALAQQGSLVEVDLSGINEIDTAGVQLLLWAKRTAMARNKELRLVGQSPTVVHVLETLGLTAYFGAPAFFLFGMEESVEETP
jgi:anti-sigma B factor antagonist